MWHPLVSIVTPVYNSERFIKETILSVLNQTYGEWEMILVDDCSRDNSFEIIKNFEVIDDRIKVLKLAKNSGPGLARNRAILEAKGKYIAFLDSDDIWRKDKLEVQLKFMLKNDAAFSHTSYGFIDEDGNRIKATYHVSHFPIGYKDLLKRTEVSCLTAMYDQEKLGKFYMPNLRRKQDYALWLSILKSGVKSIPLDEELAYYRQRRGSVTSDKYKLIFNHYSFLRSHERLKRPEALKYTICWMLNGFLKYYLPVGLS